MKIKGCAVFAGTIASLLAGTLAYGAEFGWSDVAPGVEQAGLEGEFVTLDSVGIQLWVPSVLSEYELTDEDVEDGIVAYYETDDESDYVSIYTEDWDDMASFEESMKEISDFSEFEEAVINGLPAVSYENTDDGIGFFSYMAPEGQIVTIEWGYAEDEGFKQLCSIISASVMSSDDSAAEDATAEEAEEAEETDETEEFDAASYEGIGTSLDNPVPFDYHNVDASAYEGVWVETGLGFDVYVPNDWEVLDIPEEAAAQGLVFGVGEPGGGNNLMVTAIALSDDTYDLESAMAELSPNYQYIYYADLSGIPAICFEDDTNDVCGFCFISDGYLISGVSSGDAGDPTIQNIIISVSPTEAEKAE